MFNLLLVREIAAELRRAHPPLDVTAFVARAMDGLEPLELTARAAHIADALYEFLPQPFARAAAVIEASLGPEIPATGEMGLTALRYLPYVTYVQKFGLDDSRGQYGIARKAIPPARDRMQSDLLTGAVGFLLVLKALLVSAPIFRSDPPPFWFWSAWAVSAAFALLVWLLRSATWPAAMLGGAICLDLLLARVHGGAWWRTPLPALVALFVLTFAATRFGRRHKERLGTAEPRTGRRASQVIANLGVAGLCAGAASPLLFLACVAALAEATADTVSSEMGQVLGGRTLLITTLREVPPGIDGGISVAGTLLGAASALLIACVAAFARPLRLPAAALVFVAGTAGLLFDSLLGATVERRGWLGNDLVNFTSTAIAAALAYGCSRWLSN